MKRITRTFIWAVILILGISCMGLSAENVDAAVKKPGKVTLVSATAGGQTVVNLKWKKVSGAKGYEIIRSGKAIFRTSAKATTYKSSGLKAGTKYSYSVRAFNIQYQKQWYNKSTKKWQTKMPKKKYRGQSRIKKTFVYGPASSLKIVKTKPAVKSPTKPASNNSNPTPTTPTTQNVKLEKAKVMNKYPIYDYSIPSFSGASSEAIEELKWFASYRDNQDIIVYLKLNNDVNDIYFINQTTGKNLYVDNVFFIYKPSDLRGYSSHHFADVSYSYRNEDDELFGRVGKGEYLCAMYTTEDSIKAGTNTLTIVADGNKVGTVSVNIKSRAQRYMQFAEQTIAAAQAAYSPTTYGGYSPYYSWPYRSYKVKNGVATYRSGHGVYENYTKNLALLEKVAKTESYINLTWGYGPTVKRGGHQLIRSLGNYGSTVDVMSGGCEDGAAMISICCMYLGLDAETYYTDNSHRECKINNAEAKFGNSLIVDATPHTVDFTGMTESQCDAYIRSLPRIVF